MQPLSSSFFSTGLRRRGLAVAGIVAVAVFAVLASRFWHPYYGFTKWVQLDEYDARAGVREVREQPLFVYAGASGYDGSSYTQIAFHPLLDSPELAPAIDNLPYRARRILGSALAFVFSAGDPRHIASVYAGLNVGVWLMMAVLLWRTLPVTDARSWLAWAGVMFSAGALHSVRFALTDLLGTTLATAAVAAAERNRRGAGLALLAAAGLARETVLTAVVGLWRGPWRSIPTWGRKVVSAVAVALPLALWMLYIRWRVGPADQGFGNFAPPLGGWIAKWGEIGVIYVTGPNFHWLNTTTLLALVALTVQAAWILRRPRVDNPWWRVGAAGVAMMAFLGTAVWEGQPGAATRVLLPMGVAFAALAVRERASMRWIVAGGLTAFSGVLALWHVPDDPGELASGRFARGGYVVRTGDGWFGLERDRHRIWAWCATRGVLDIRTAAGAAGRVQVRVRLRAITPRAVEIRDANAVVWHGRIGERAESITFPVTLAATGRIALAIASDAPPVSEPGSGGARALGLAVYEVRLE